MIFENEQKELLEELMDVQPEVISKYLEAHRTDFYGNKAFSTYMRHKFREKKLSQKSVFEKANITINYGYKLISEEKKTAQRDLIIRLCLALKMDANETQRALELSGFSGWDVHVRRDVILMVLINNGIYSLDEVNHFLTENDEKSIEA